MALSAIPRLDRPIVLVHGLLGFDALMPIRRGVERYFRGLDRQLIGAGNRVSVPLLGATSGTRERAGELARHVRREFGREKVHLIGHSLGGLDARYAVSRLGLEAASVTTIGTPHRGTSFADWLTTYCWRWLRSLARMLGTSFRALHDLTTSGAARLNAEAPDAEGVSYQSVGGLCEVFDAWTVPGRVVTRFEGANDGVVSLDSARWGDRFEVWEGDHLNLVNWPNRRERKLGVWCDRGESYGRLLARVEAVKPEDPQ